MTKKIKVCCHAALHRINFGTLKYQPKDGYCTLNTEDIVGYCPFCGVKIELEEENPKEPYCYGETCKHYAGQTTGVLNLIACNKRKDNEYGFVPFSAKCGDYEPKPKPKVKKRWYAKAYGKSENPTDAFFLLFRDNCDSIYRRYKAGEEHKLKLEPETNRLYIETDSE